MTIEQKQKLLHLRDNGASPTEIAAVTGLSRNTIKSFYQRLKKNDVPDGRFCNQCGIPLPEHMRRGNTRFCSDKCRMTWWNHGPGQQSSAVMIALVCPFCGSSFRSYPSSHRKYCSRTCYVQARFEGASHAE